MAFNTIARAPNLSDVVQHPDQLAAVVHGDTPRR